MKKRKAKVIKDPKARGEWVESVFMARACEYGLPVSRPWGESNSYDFVVGRPRRFVSVQVKSTMVKCGGGYLCSVRRNNQPYAPGSFDFLAAYVIPEDVWYIIPASKVVDRESVIVNSTAAQAQYEEYREKWELLREATASVEDIIVGAEPEKRPAAEEAPQFPRNAMERMEAAANLFRGYIEQRPHPSRKERG